MAAITDEWVDADGVSLHCLRAEPGAGSGTAETVREGSDSVREGSDAGTGRDAPAGATGPPVVLLHGGVIDAASLSWGGVLEPLAEALDRPVLAPDLAGYGESDRPVAPYTTAYHVEVIRSFLDALELGRVDVCGLSLGGGVALGLALTDDRVERLVAVDSYGLGTALPRGLLTWLVSRVPQLNRLSLALLRRSRSLTRASLGGVVADPDAVPDEVVDELYRLVNREGAGHAFRQWRRREVTRHGYATTYVDLLDGLDQPALFLHGAEDELFTPAWSERAARRAPEGECEVLADCAHWPPRERPDAFVERVADFLDVD